ncbi:MAG: imidazole glycerol phosphate synthase subunit HisF [Candidatus Pelagibacter sp. TMED273]|nr:MAG: imidazole glycerol phosphate synthase subunit HisF [Candidatus Pelagibacter sp. TMED273]|tara:strand:- start:10159 stop:10896 length:738 start_codon:yes stop_codon:yes gene_type:complete
MNSLRIVSRIDLKNDNVIKGFHLEGWKKLGRPINFAKKYYLNGADEIIFIDSVASLFSRDKILNILKESSKKIFIPIGIGGGIKTIEDARQILNNGADKIVVNTAFVKNPMLIKKFVKTFGSQSIMLSIQAKKRKQDFWEVFTEAGREKSGKEVRAWIKYAEKLGVGELLVTSVDNEGLGKGIDLELFKEIKKITNLPIIAGGGFGNLKQIKDIKKLNISGISIAQLFHYNAETPNSIKKKFHEN